MAMHVYAVVRVRVRPGMHLFTTCLSACMHVSIPLGGCACVCVWPDWLYELLSALIHVCMHDKLYVQACMYDVLR